MIKNRELISLDGRCPYRCKHCYTYGLPNVKNRTSEEIISSLNEKNFDVVYISQKNENFSDPIAGIELCEKVFDKFHCHIFIITRNIIPKELYDRLVLLNQKMKEHKKVLFIGSSVIGLESASFSERLDIIPTPEDRLRFLKDIYNLNIPTLLLIRPLFPSRIIPSEEIEKIIDIVDGEVSCILTGPLMVNESILEQLNLKENDFDYMIGGESEYLNGAIKDTMKFVDVNKEIGHLKMYCLQKQIKFFEHSMPALNDLLKDIQN